MKHNLLFLLIFLSVPALAGEGFMGFGLGLFNSAKDGPGEVKTYQIGYRGNMGHGYYWQTKLGFWGQGENQYGMKSGGYGSTGPGIKVDLSPVELHAGYGIGAITTPDQYLGGVFPQFNGEFGIGLRDKSGNGIGIKYEHISSAGLCMPNMGRDFIVLEIGTKW